MAKRFYFTLKLVSILILVKHLQATELSSNIIFSGNSTTCLMFSKDCIFNLLISKTINLHDISFESENTKIFAFNSIDKCENESICLMDKFNALNLNFYINDGFEVYQIHIMTEILGKAYLKVKLKDKKFQQHLIVVKSEMRLVDR